MEINVATGETEYGITGAKDYVSLEDRLWGQRRYDVQPLWREAMKTNYVLLILVYSLL
jgi:hypothetical protein